eukprot:TRINITY_DN4041_c0_g1_i3.p1 TRINITY_DN4041_c0_g1~~TRINITY_DN4041_c0_g1_i3.p1  ORF type:complete len:105 (-),score=10.13 TRINITY_DN4041_c0_g1_i3:109-423(-)
MFASADTDKNGRITFEEFRQLFLSRSQSTGDERLECVKSNIVTEKTPSNISQPALNRLQGATSTSHAVLHSQTQSSSRSIPTNAPAAAPTKPRFCTSCGQRLPQ